LAGIKPLKSGVNLLYLYNYLLTRKTHFESQATGSTFKAINGKIIENEVVPLPPLAEQKRIVDKLDRIMPLIDEYAKSYTHLAEIDSSFNDRMKKSILQYAMEGKLVPQDPSDQPASELLAEIQQEKMKLVKEKKIKKTKPLPAISEDEIPFEIPDSWEWVRLGDVTRILMGQAPKGDTVSSNKENGIEFHQGKTFFGPKVIQRSDKYTSQD
ncbi:restriction endonuclease subunit S, partial [Lactobacillus delbrueckii]